MKLPKELPIKFPTFFNKFKIRNQLVFVYVTLIIIPILILGFFFIQFTRNELLSRYETQLTYNANSIDLLFLDITETNHSIASSLYNDETIQQLLSTDEDRSTLLQRVFHINNLDVYGNSSSISNITIYTEDSALDNVSNFKYIDEDIKQTDCYNKAMNQASAFYILTNDNSYNELTFIQKIEYPKIDDYIILEITTSYNFLRSRLINAYSDAYLKLNDEYFFLGSNTDISVLDEMFSTHNFSGISKINDQPYLYSTSTITPYLSDDTIELALIDKFGISQTTSIIKITLITILFVFLLTSFFIIAFIYTLNRRLYILKHQVQTGIAGNYLIYQELEGNDEISELFNYIKTILVQFKESEKIIYNSKLNKQKFINEQQKMEFKMLSSQINPHFLYNTLETIRMKALTSGNRDLAKSIQLLGKSMRYVLENTTSSTTTLERELDYIKTYIEIQNIRFDQNITYTLEYLCNMPSTHVYILPLMIQPIVENSILHGFEDTTYKGEIKITIYENPINLGELIIEIQDNGTGLTQDKLNKLNTNKYLGNELKETSKSIGIENINKRLKLYYSSKPIYFEINNYGVKATFSIPLTRSEKFETTTM